MDLAVLLTEAMSSPPRAASGGRGGVADALLAPPPNAASLHRGQRLSVSIIIIYRAYYDAFWPGIGTSPGLGAGQAATSLAYEQCWPLPAVLGVGDSEAEGRQTAPSIFTILSTLHPGMSIPHHGRKLS